MLGWLERFSNKMSSPCFAKDASTRVSLVYLYIAISLYYCIILADYIHGRCQEILEMENTFTCDAFPGFTFSHRIVPIPMSEITLPQLNRVSVGGSLREDRIDGNEFVTRLLTTGNTLPGVGYLATLLQPENWNSLWETHFDWRNGIHYFYEKGCFDKDGDLCILSLSYSARKWLFGSTKLSDDYWFNGEAFGIYLDQ